MVFPTPTYRVTLPETSSKRTWKWMVGRWRSLLGFGLFSGDMLVLGRVISSPHFRIFVFSSHHWVSQANFEVDRCWWVPRLWPSSNFQAVDSNGAKQNIHIFRGWVGVGLVHLKEDIYRISDFLRKLGVLFMTWILEMQVAKYPARMPFWTLKEYRFLG